MIPPPEEILDLAFPPSRWPGEREAAQAIEVPHICRPDSQTGVCMHCGDYAVHMLWYG